MPISVRFLFTVFKVYSISETKLVAYMQNPHVKINVMVNISPTVKSDADSLAMHIKYPVGVVHAKGNLIGNIFQFKKFIICGEKTKKKAAHVAG